jgi:hypothetical protein
MLDSFKVQGGTDHVFSKSTRRYLKNIIPMIYNQSSEEIVLDSWKKTLDDFILDFFSCWTFELVIYIK